MSGTPPLAILGWRCLERLDPRSAKGERQRGLVAASALDDFVASLLFGVAPGDATTLTAVAAGMIVVTWLACLIPARRATQVDPVEVLKSD